MKEQKNTTTNARKISVKKNKDKEKEKESSKTQRKVVSPISKLKVQSNTINEMRKNSQKLSSDKKLITSSNFNKDKVNKNNVISSFTGKKIKRNDSYNALSHSKKSSQKHIVSSGKRKKVKSLSREKDNGNSSNRKEEEISGFVENKYDFDLYKHLKDNIKNKADLCGHIINENSFYCYDCGLSTCPECSNYLGHKNHKLLNRYHYYNLIAFLFFFLYYISNLYYMTLIKKILCVAY